MKGNPENKSLARRYLRVVSVLIRSLGGVYGIRDTSLEVFPHLAAVSLKQQFLFVPIAGEVNLTLCLEGSCNLSAG